MPRNPLAPAQRFGDVLVGFECGKDEYAGVGHVLLGADGCGRVESVGAGHPDIHQHDVGVVFAGQRNGFVAVGRLADHCHVRVGLDEHPESRTQQRLVVGE